MKANVFIAFTKSQINTISHIACNLDGDNVLISNETFITDNKIFLKHLLINKKKGISDVIRELWKRSYSKSIESFINEIIQEYDEIDLFVSHFMNILTSDVVSRLRCYKEKKNIQISSYPDGILSFYPYYVENKFCWENIQRKTSSLLTGMKFKMVSGPIADPFNIVDKIYSYYPEYTVKYNSKNIIPIVLDTKINDGKNIVVLGHANQKALGRNQLMSIVCGISNKIKQHQSPVIVYYKPHPRTLNINEDIFYKYLYSEYNNIMIIDDPMPIETIIEHLKIGFVYSVASSAMINLKTIYGSTIECVSFGTEYYVQNNYLKYYQSIFNVVGVKML